MYKSRFGIVIKKMRLKRELTQEQLAARSNLERTFISMLERGVKQPSLETIGGLAHAFDLKSYELLHMLEHEIHVANCVSDHDQDRYEEQRRLEQLEVEHEKLRIGEIVNSIPIVFFARTPMPEYAVIFVSRNIQQLFGYDRENFMGPIKFWLDHIHPADRPGVLDQLRKIHMNGALSHEYRFRMADERWLRIREELKLIAGETGTPREVIGTMTGEPCEG